MSDHFGWSVQNVYTWLPLMKLEAQSLHVLLLLTGVRGSFLLTLSGEHAMATSLGQPGQQNTHPAHCCLHASWGPLMKPSRSHSICGCQKKWWETWSLKLLICRDPPLSFALDLSRTKMWKLACVCIRWWEFRIPCKETSLVENVFCLPTVRLYRHLCL